MDAEAGTDKEKKFLIEGEWFRVEAVVTDNWNMQSR